MVARVVFVLIDGIADVAVPVLEYKTPLQAANIPAFDAIAAAGVNGLMDPVEPGLACGSDTAHMSIFGYDPRLYYKGRGGFESMGAGLYMEKGDIAFKCNFATVDPLTKLVVRRRVDRHFPDWGLPLCDFLNGLKLPSFPDCEVSVQWATEHRCGLRVRGPNLCGDSTGTDPLKDNLPLLTAEPTPEATDMFKAQRTSQLINELSETIHTMLSSHPINIERIQKGLPPANIVLLRGCGERIDVPTFLERHGLHAFMIAPTAIIAGLGLSVDMKLVKVKGATGDYHTDLLAKAQGAVTLLTGGSVQDDNGNETAGPFDFGFVHVKAVDDAGHDKNVQAKVAYLEKANAMVGSILKGLAEAEATGSDKYIAVVTGDHSTPVIYGDHSHEPVPFAIARVSEAYRFLSESGAVSPSCTADCVKTFDEVAARDGFLGRFTGAQIMNLIKSFRNLP
eukprot:GILJ01007621.1.p1 GENE.GILJ01007621.1~~GILJ01007621.1.p1  ORF type:complete len:464 (+),score=62.91 GILJ01007621.1:43-1392(+)